MKQYMAVGVDKYELPLAAADTPTELARLLGVTPNAVNSAIHRSAQCNGRCTGYKLIVVEIDDYIDPLDEEERMEDI